jgi:hypothetical protein
MTTLTLKAKPFIAFKGHQYNAEAVLAHLAMAPAVEVPQAALSHEANVEPRDKLTDRVRAKLFYREPVFAKFEGKFVVLLGEHTAAAELAQQGKVKGRLISNPTLKRCLL